MAEPHGPGPAPAALPRTTPSAQGRCWHTVSGLARFALRVAPSDQAVATLQSGGVPISPNACRADQRGDWAALWLGPDEQLLLGPEREAAALAARVHQALDPTPHALVDISHRQVGIALASRCAADLLSSGCPLDFDLAAFPVGACTRSVYAKAEVVLWRRAEQQFHLEAWRSFIPYVAGLLAQAEREFQV